jgi:ABC-type uncharacterized transport system substrate-binding protein
MKNTSTFAKKTVLVTFLLFVVIGSLMISGCSTNSPTNAPETDDPSVSEESSQAEYAGKKVIFVNSYHIGYPWSDGIESGLREVFEGTGVEFKTIELDTKNNPDEDFGIAAGKKAQSEIEAFAPDVVIACDDNAQKYLVVPYYEGSSTPVVFCGVNWDASVYGFPTSNVTGMVEVELPDQMISLLKGYTNGDRVGYITVDSETERKVVNTYNERFFDGQLQPYWVSTQEEFKETFLAAQEEVDILFMGNNAGSDVWDEAEMQQFILENTTVPTGSINDWMAPYALLTLAKSAKEQGEWSAQTALSILEGTSVSAIEIAENKKGELIVNLEIADKLNVVFAPSLLKNASIIGE